MSKVISFFNHKGGVGKTTSVHNIGYGLSKLGKKVLLIDADPQMNLTAAVYGLSTQTIYSNDDESKWKDINKRYTSICSIIKSIVGRKDIPNKPYQKKDERNDVTFYLLRGDITLNNLDSNLMQIIQSGNELTNRLIFDIEKKLKSIYDDYDFVLIDQSPSASSILNAIFSLTSSYVIIPSTPTFFCLQAVNNLTDIWKHWHKLLANFKSTFNNDGLSLNSKFLGIIIQLGKRWKSGNAEHTNTWKSLVNQGILSFVDYLGDKSISKNDFKKNF